MSIKCFVHMSPSLHNWSIRTCGKKGKDAGHDNISRHWVMSSKSTIYIQLFRERLSEKLCMRQSQKVIWDMINNLFLTLQLSNILLFLSFSNYNHKFMASSSILANFLMTVNSKPPTIPFGIVACTFSDNLSRNSCITNFLNCYSSSFLYNTGQKYKTSTPPGFEPGIP